MINNTAEEFYTNANWNKPIENLGHTPGPQYVDLFDQNGYRLTLLEGLYADTNSQPPTYHREERSLKKEWFTQEYKDTGAILNHAALFERKGYEGEALDQLNVWAKQNNTLYKLIRYRAKWGIDLSIDYVDADGNAFEVLHYEFDGFYLDEIQEMKLKLESVITTTDWDFAAKAVLLRKSEWHGLGFFAQSDWKCQFFGLGSERFKIIAWD